MSKLYRNRVVLPAFYIALALAFGGCSRQAQPELPAAPVAGGEEQQAEAAPETVIFFYDAVIEAETRRILDIPDGDITVRDVLSITSFGNVTVRDVRSVASFGSAGDVERYNSIEGDIVTLTDLRWFKNLEILELSGCGLRSLSGVEELFELRSLYVGHNSITSLLPVSGLSNLVDFYCVGNSVFDYSALGKLSNLESLAIGDNGALSTDISALSGLTGLKRLTAPWCGVSDISALQELHSLEYLHLSNNSISDISALGGLQNLEYVYLSMNQVSDIGPLFGLRNLRHVVLDDNPIPPGVLEGFYWPGASDYYTMDYRGRVKDEMPELAFEIVLYNNKRVGHLEAVKIIVKEAGSGAVLQELAPPEYAFWGYLATSFGDDFGFVVEDLNFDGYADIRIAEYTGRGSNSSYMCWVWDAAAGVFVYDTALSNIPGMQVDHENEVIWASLSLSLYDRVTLYYSYIDGDLTLVKHVLTRPADDDDSSATLTDTSILVDGAWVTTTEASQGGE